MRDHLYVCVSAWISGSALLLASFGAGAVAQPKFPDVLVQGALDDAPPALARIQEISFLFRLQAQRLGAWGRLDRAGAGSAPSSSVQAAERERAGFVEAVRLARWKKAGEHCLSALALPPQGEANQPALDSDWELACAEAMVRGTEPGLHADSKIDARVWKGFFGSALLVNPKTRQRRKIFEALVLRNVKRPREALGVLNAAVGKANEPQVGEVTTAKALLLVELGRFDESLATSRAYLKESSESEGRGVAARNPRATLFLRANIARLLALRGQLDAASTWFDEATESARQLEGADGKAAALGRYSSLQLRAERAGVWLRLGKVEQAGLALEELRADPGWTGVAQALPLGKAREQELERARLLLRHPSSRPGGIRRLTALLGEADADSRFLKDQAPKKEQIAAKEAALANGRRPGGVADVEALLRLADEYGAEEGDASAAARLIKLAQDAGGFERDLRREVLAALQTRDRDGLGMRPSPALAAGLAALEREAVRWKASLRRLDGLSQAVWDASRGGGEEAAKLHAELWRRMGALDDQVARVLIEARSWRTQREPVRALALLRQLEERQAKLLARLASAKILVGGGREVDVLISGAQAVQRQIDGVALGIRSALLKSSLDALPGLAPGAAQEMLQASFAELRELHGRRRRIVAGASDDQFLASLESAWADAAEVLERMGQRRGELLQEENLALQGLHGGVQAVFRATETHARSAADLRSKLSSEGARLAPGMAEDLSPRVDAFRARVRSALAEADMGTLRELEAQEAMRLEADRERASWLQSQRESIIWGSAR